MTQTQLAKAVGGKSVVDRTSLQFPDQPAGRPSVVNGRPVCLMGLQQCAVLAAFWCSSRLPVSTSFFLALEVYD